MTIIKKPENHPQNINAWIEEFCNQLKSIKGTEWYDDAKVSLDEIFKDKTSGSNQGSTGGSTNSIQQIGENSLLLNGSINPLGENSNEIKNCIVAGEASFARTSDSIAFGTNSLAGVCTHIIEKDKLLNAKESSEYDSAKFATTYTITFDGIILGGFSIFDHTCKVGMHLKLIYGKDILDLEISEKFSDPESTFLPNTHMKFKTPVILKFIDEPIPDAFTFILPIIENTIDTDISNNRYTTSTALGYHTVSYGTGAHAEGNITSSVGLGAHAEGRDTISNGTGAHAEGVKTCAFGNGAHAQNIGTIANEGQTAIGKYNLPINDYHNMFIIGNGTKEKRSNCFRITDRGVTYSNGAYKSTGADYAELFEWEDGNINSEDRIGYFVTLNEDMIKLCDSKSKPLGIISATAIVVGNSYSEEWCDTYLKDEWGRIQYEKRTIDGEEVDVPKLNPNYDKNKKYIPRDTRREYDEVGLFGQLLVRDDGTCVPNGYCKCTDGGIATKSDTGYRVLKRINDNIVKILFIMDI